MTNNENLIPIPGRLHSVATEGHVSGADEIYDDTQQKDQATINSELIQAVGTGGSVDSKIATAKEEIIGDAATDYNTLGKLEDKIQAEATRAEAAEEALDGRVDTLEDAVGTGGSVDSRISAAVATETTRAQAAEDDRYTKSETYSKTELNNLITTPNQEYVSVIATAQTTAATDVLPATGAADTTYRVGNWDGTQYNDSVFSEYAWNGSTYIKLSTKSQIGEVYDVSVNHADTKYADLAAALGTNGANIPQSLKKGGMSVKFVQSSDNKYVQYRLMSYTFNTTVANWQGVDDKPTAESDNLVKSGGVELKLRDFKENVFLSNVNVLAQDYTYEVYTPTLLTGKQYILKIISDGVIKSDAYVVCYENDYTTYKTFDVSRDYIYTPDRDITKFILFIRGPFVEQTGEITLYLEPSENYINLGKCLFRCNNLNELVSGYVDSSGQFVSGTLNCTDYISAPKGVKLKTYNAYIGDNSYICFYDKNKNFVRSIGSSQADNSNQVEFELEENEVFFRVAFLNAPAAIYYIDKCIKNDVVSTIFENINELSERIEETFINQISITSQSDATYEVPNLDLKSGNEYKIRVNSNGVLVPDAYIICYINTLDQYFELSYDTDVYYTPNVDITKFILYIRGNFVQTLGNISVYIENLETISQDIKNLNDKNQDLSISLFSSIGVCGDSYTVGAVYIGSTFIGEKKESSWGKILGRQNGVDVSVFARSGATTKTFLTDSSCLPALLNDTPKELYILNLGINDTQYTLGSISDIHEDYTENPDTFYGNYGRIIDQIIAYAPNAKIAIMKVLASNYSSAGYKWSSKAIEEIAAHYGIACIDTLNSKFLRSSWLTNNCENNGGHPTPIAQSGIAKAVQQILEKLMKTTYYNYFVDYYPA